MLYTPSIPLSNHLVTFAADARLKSIPPSSATVLLESHSGATILIRLPTQTFMNLRHCLHLTSPFPHTHKAHANDLVPVLGYVFLGFEPLSLLGTMYSIHGNSDDHQVWLMPDSFAVCWNCWCDNDIGTTAGAWWAVACESLWQL